jgi:hypothetical protein
MLQARSGLDRSFPPPFLRDTYPDREFYPPLQYTLRKCLLTSNGLVAQDIRHFGLILCRGMQKYMRLRLFVLSTHKKLAIWFL